MIVNLLIPILKWMKIFIWKMLKYLDYNRRFITWNLRIKELGWSMKWLRKDLVWFNWKLMLRTRGYFSWKMMPGILFIIMMPLWWLRTPCWDRMRISLGVSNIQLKIWKTREKHRRNNNKKKSEIFNNWTSRNRHFKSAPCHKSDNTTSK